MDGHWSHLRQAILLTTKPKVIQGTFKHYTLLQAWPVCGTGCDLISQLVAILDFLASEIEQPLASMLTLFSMTATGKLPLQSVQI